MSVPFVAERSTPFSRKISRSFSRLTTPAPDPARPQRDPEASIYVIRGDNDVSIFSAAIEEIQEEFSDAEAGIIKSIADKSEEVRKLEQALETTQQLINGKLQQKPQTPTFKEVTQAEFNQKVREREALTLDWAHPYPVARAPQKRATPKDGPFFIQSTH
jgi:hypothetical protein